MTVSKREMNAIVAALIRARPDDREKRTGSMLMRDQWTKDVCEIAVALSKLNPRFNAATFAAAVKSNG